MFKEIFSGIAGYSKAVRLISKLNLWAYMLLPMLISVLLAAGVFSLSWWWGDELGQFIANWYPWERGAQTVEKISSIFGGVLVVVAGIFLYKNLVLIIVGPFMSPLSEKVEASLTGRQVENGFRLGRFIRDFFRGLRLALRSVTREVFCTILLLLLGLIPLFSPFTAIGIFLVQAYYAGVGNFDYYLERRANVTQSIRYARQNRWLVVGNGIVFVGLLFTVVGFLFAPVLGVIAGTVSAIEKEKTTF